MKELVRKKIKGRRISSPPRSEQRVHIIQAEPSETRTTHIHTTLDTKTCSEAMPSSGHTPSNLGNFDEKFRGGERTIHTEAFTGVFAWFFDFIGVFMILGLKIRPFMPNKKTKTKIAPVHAFVSMMRPSPPKFRSKLRKLEFAWSLLSEFAQFGLNVGQMLENQ